jgi:ABC-type branched-subunit amino acid transport system ATPase component
MLSGVVGDNMPVRVFGANGVNKETIMNTLKGLLKAVLPITAKEITRRLPGIPG